MRKLLAVLLAAIMLVGVLAALPVGAETARVSEFDGTTSDCTTDLVITEILVNSKTGQAALDDQLIEGDVATWVSPDAFDFIEIYNRGSEPVDLYDYSIVRANGKQFIDKSEDSSTVGYFTKRVDLAKGEIFQHADVTAGLRGQYDVFVNPEDATLMPGEFAVIWFYDADTTKLTDYKKENLTAADFIAHYNMPEDTLLLAVCAKPTVENTLFSLATNYTYALVYDEFDIEQNVVSSAWGQGDEASLTENGELIVCMADYIAHNAVGIITEENTDDMSAYYVPANCTPDVLNEVKWKGCVTEEEKAAYKALNDYVEADYVQTYLSSAIVSYIEKPAPGTMPAWQWAYVDPVGETKTVSGMQYTHGLQALSAAAEGADYDKKMKALVFDWETNTAIKGQDGKLDVTETEGKVAWSTTCINDLVVVSSSAITGDGNKTEEKIDYKKNFVSRDELEKRHQQKQTGTNEEEGLPIWALILIIVGGVVLVAGIAVVVIIIIKKKNKPVAADDVAAEGEIQVVDETEANEAPADESKE